MSGHLRLYRVADSASVLGATARGAAKSGLVRPLRPSATFRLTNGVRRWGTSPAVGFSLGSARHPDSIAVIDTDDDTLRAVSFVDIDHRCDTLALSLLDRGIGPGSQVGVLGRNSRGFLEAMVGVSRTGADVVFLNPASSADQISTIAYGQRLELILRDQEFADLVPTGIPSIAIDDKSGLPLLASLPNKGELPNLKRHSHHVILTSGTTSGDAKGASRSSIPLSAAAAILDAFPVHMNGTTLFAAPMFHSWGWMHHRLATLLDSTHVLVRHPEAERLLSLIDEHEVDTLVTTPVVLRRLVDLPRHVRRRYKTDSLQLVAVSGSDLPGDLATKFMDAFGDILYNLYGSTEAAFATCATPEDLRAEPNTAGRPLVGVHLEILDRLGRDVPVGSEGRVYVGSRTTFRGYTDGTDRERVRGMVFTGDIGRLDDAGRLTIVGRADDVVVTGGENVHPAEVEEVLRQHPNVADVAVTGVPDPVYGAALVAHVVPTDDEINPDDILDWSRAQLGPNHRPRRIELRDELPRDPSGKLQRRVLAGDLDAADDELD